MDSIPTLTNTLGMGSVIAVRNLLHDRTRLIVTLVGIVFAVLLMNIELGLFLGFTSTTSSIIDRAGADLWIMATGTQDVDQASPISERRLYQALALPDVVKAGRLNVEFADFKRLDGGTESVLVIGFDPDSGLGGPWNVVEGSIRDLRYPNTIMMDELYRQKLGVSHLGQIVEISGRRAEVVGFTRGIRSFTQSPYVFASSQTALNYSRIRADETKYVLVKVSPDSDLSSVRNKLHKAMSDVDIMSAGDFSRSTEVYWMFTTGAGLALLVAAFLGLIVGAVVISQTLYATTVDHLREFATLRALGAADTYIYGIITRQALISAVLGYVLGLWLSLTVMRMTSNTGVLVLLPGWLLIVMFFITVFMCLGAAVISIRKAMRLDPAMVFK
jgi:putative ABC transport system permease protein